MTTLGELGRNKVNPGHREDTGSGTSGFPGALGALSATCRLRLSRPAYSHVPEPPGHPLVCSQFLAYKKWIIHQVQIRVYFPFETFPDYPSIYMMVLLEFVEALLLVQLIWQL